MSVVRAHARCISHPLWPLPSPPPPPLEWRGVGPRFVVLAKAARANDKGHSSPWPSLHLMASLSLPLLHRESFAPLLLSSSSLSVRLVTKLS